MLVALVVFGVSHVTSHWPDNARFGCGSAARSGIADASTGCPSSIGHAGEDPVWATARIMTIPILGSTTIGLFYDQDGHETRYASERNVDSDTALNVGRDAGVFPASGRPNVVDHVEVKVAAAMRARQVARGVMVINNSNGPCGRDTDARFSCSVVVPKLLPAGSTRIA